MKPDYRRVIMTRKMLYDIPFEKVGKKKVTRLVDVYIRSEVILFWDSAKLMALFGGLLKQEI